MRERRVLIVGEDFGHSPARYHSDRYALTGASGRRLAELAGFESVVGFMLSAERTNVVELPEHWEDDVRVEAGVAAILPRMTGRRTILLGRKVQRAFGAARREPFAWADDVAVAPHPSGRSHFWNDPANVAVARAFWTGALA